MAETDETIGYYGVVIPDKRYHISPLCPYLQTIKNWKEGITSQYTQETDAILSGHVKRCPVCFSMYRFKIKRGDKYHEFLLGMSSIRILLAMAELHRKREKVTITALAQLTSVDYEYANDAMKKLKKLKLVAGSEWLGEKMNRGRRKFTTMGVAVVSAYKSNLYSPPILSSPEHQGEAPEPNIRLI